MRKTLCRECGSFQYFECPVCETLICAHCGEEMYIMREDLPMYTLDKDKPKESVEKLHKALEDAMGE